MLGKAVSKVVQRVRTVARSKRARVFLDNFVLGAQTHVLDIGSEDGSNIARVLGGTRVQPHNVYIADISAEMVSSGHAQYGFVPVTIPETGRLPFDDGFFDIVYCSSVIEHVTVPKEKVWKVRSGSEFRKAADESQRAFAQEIRRLGKRYFIQTPNKWFPIESHTWLPFIGYLPRPWQVSILRFSNRVWVKRTRPDWRLLTVADMRTLFPDAVIERERFLGMTKSIMAIKR